MNNKIEYLKPEFVIHIPRELESGVLYISEEYGISIHLCACGCGQQTVLNFKPQWKDGWEMIKSYEGKISFRPSIGNFNFACKSHYYITDNKIEWI